MEFAAALSDRPESDAALDEAATLASAMLSRPPDLIVSFATPHHAGAVGHIAGRLVEIGAAGSTSLGAIADGVIGDRREIDEGAGLVVWAAVLDDASVESVHLEAVRTPGGVAVGGWSQPSEAAGALLVADPFTFPAAGFAGRLGARGLPVAGGLANPEGRPGGAVLIVDGEVARRGAVGAVLGGLDFRTVVSQGCRPVGTPAVVTSAEGSLIVQIGGKPALEYLQDMVDELEPSDRRLVEQGLQIGVAVDEYRSEFGRGDFLVRGVVAADPDMGTVSIGDEVAVGTTVQFQVRDPQGADEDLRELLADEPTGSGVLLFTCTGRGRRFFGAPDHDAVVISDVLHPPAVAGFFASGELGPVRGENHLHGFTASVAELRASSGGPGSPA
jgi:small ligand-binding sensory domain FIST